MNISQFNEELRKKILRAQRLERQSYFKAAKEAWVDVSEFTLNASKDPKIDSTFRNMLIAKTEKIIEHLKKLQESKIERTREGFGVKEESSKSTESELYANKQVLSELEREIYIKGEKESSEKSIEKDPNKKEINLNDLPDVPKEIKVKKSSEFKNIPSGFKEIETSEDFKIITPFDVKFVEDRLKSADEYDQKIKSLKKSSKNHEKSSNIELKGKTKDGRVICFACGTVNPPGTKKCGNCGTEL